MMFLRGAAKPIEPEQVWRPPEGAIRILVGGDVCFDDGVTRPVPPLRRVRRLTLGQRLRGAFIRRFHPYLPQGKDKQRQAHRLNLAVTELHLDAPHRSASRTVGQESPGAATAIAASESGSRTDRVDPFSFLVPLIRQSDFTLFNLETPLAGRNTRKTGMMRSDPGYAPIMARAGVSMVNLANNHIFDAGEEGLRQTVSNLTAASIAYTGYGESLERARQGVVCDIRGLKICFLGYTHYCNSDFHSIAAEYPGILPLDPELVLADIRNARQRSDLVMISLHWGVEDQPYVQRWCEDLAHRFIDAGADAIIGHHPHVPHGIEVYRGKPIIYSLGNLVFGAPEKEWMDNILVQIVLDGTQPSGLVVYPVTGLGADLSQPKILSGERAKSALEEIRLRSAVFSTAISIRDDVGYITLRPDAGKGSRD